MVEELRPSPTSSTMVEELRPSPTSSTMDRFIEMLGEGRVFLHAQVRNKYREGVGKRIICSRICHTRKLKQVVRGMEAEIPEEYRDCTVIYCSWELVDLKRANRAFAAKMMNVAFDDQGAFLPRLVHSCYASNTFSRYARVDVDAPWAIPKVLELLREHDVPVAARVVTRGGEHVIVDLDACTKAQKAALFNPVRKCLAALGTREKDDDPIASLGTKAMCPVPGTNQAGHTVRFADA